MQEKIHISFFGAGKVATYLAQNLFDASYNIKAIINRTPESGNSLAHKVRADYHNPDSLPSFFASDLIFICVSDNYIEEAATLFQHSPALVVHTSGATDINLIHASISRKGVFWPLGSFSKDEPEMENTPYCIETTIVNDYSILETISKDLKGKAYPVKSSERVHVHLAAVLGQNFTNHLIYKAQSHLERTGVDPSLLFPLIKNYVLKLENEKAVDLQTGPAIRNDGQTIEEHLTIIKDPTLRTIYQLLTESIQESYDKEL